MPGSPFADFPCGLRKRRSYYTMFRQTGLFGNTGRDAETDGFKRIVAQMVKPNTGSPGVHFHGSMAAERRHERDRVIRHARAGRWERRFESDRHNFFRFPNSAVPMRTKVAPSSIATSKSCDMPMERCGSSYFEPSSRRRRK